MYKIMHPSCVSREFGQDFIRDPFVTSSEATSQHPSHLVASGGITLLAVSSNIRLNCIFFPLDQYGHSGRGAICCRRAAESYIAEAPDLSELIKKIDNKRKSWLWIGDNKRKS